MDEIQDTTPPPAQTDDEVSKLRAENAILRAHCETWKRRVNFHSAVVYGVTKVARGQILSMRAEREQLEQKYQNLKRKCTDLEWVASRSDVAAEPGLTFCPTPRAAASPSPTSTDDRSPKLNGEKRSRPDSSESDSENRRSPPVKKKLRSSTGSTSPTLEPMN